MRRLILILALLATPLWAVEPGEVLDDPMLEARARALSQDLRCVVCRGENIDESNAGIARDLRLLVRERLVAGDSDPEVIDYVVDRYGEYVLMKPNTGGANLLLWSAGPLLFLVALLIGVFYTRRRTSVGEAGSDLSPDEQARLDELLKD